MFFTFKWVREKIGCLLECLKTSVRAGSSMLLMTIAAAMIVGLTGFSYARLYGSGYGYMEAVRSSSAGQSYLDSAVVAARNQKYDDLNTLSKTRSPIEDTGFYETVSVSGESVDGNGVISRKVEIDIFYGNETSARYSSTVDRIKYSSLNNNLYQGIGSNEDGPMSANSAYDAFILKKDAVKYSGEQVGDNNRPVYMDTNGEVHAVDFFYRGQYNNAAKKILTYSGNNIDFINKDWIIANSAIVASKNDPDLGYIRYSNGTVFAWAKGTSSNAAGKHISVEKPLPFRTLQAYATDSNYLNESNYNRLVWWIPASGLNRDVFMLNTAVGGVTDTFSVFWIGYIEKDNNWVDISVDDLLHETVTVKVTDSVTGQETVLTNGCSGIFSKGSCFTANIVADEGYEPGILSVTSGVLNGNTMITASKAKVKLAPETWDYRASAYRAGSDDTIDGVTAYYGSSTYGPKSYVYYIIDVPKSGWYVLNCKIWACTSHNHSSSNEGNSFFNVAFKLGEVYLAGTNGFVDGFTAPLYGTCDDVNLAISSCKEMNFGDSEIVYLKEGPQRVDLWIGLHEIRNKHSAMRVYKMLVTPTFIGE